MTKRYRYVAPLFLTVLLLLSACVAPAAAPQPAAPDAAAQAAADAREWGAWRDTDPYAPYPETASLTLVKGGQEGASLLPEGESIEDNRALQYIEDALNLDINFNWVVPSDTFADRLNLAIASGDIPDAMVVLPNQLQQLAAAGAIEDLTPYIDQFANADILENYAQTNGIALAAATIDGKVMGVPNVQPQADAPLMAWVRQDWLDAVGLEGPETLDDLVAIAQAFIEQDPDGDGADNTYGLTGTLNPLGVPSNLHGFDLFFNVYGAYPTLFHPNDAGEIVYGSVQPEAREALARLVELYDAGILDPDFAIKTADQSNEAVISGQAGIMVGPWWISWWPLVDSVKNDPTADWQPFMIQNLEGEYTYSMGDYTNSFVVVRAGYPHPEAVLKILNLQNDLSYGLNDAPQYYPNFNEIWGSLLPIPFLIEQPYVVERMGTEYQQALDGELDPTTLSGAMQIEFAQIEADIASPRSDSAAWATRMARLDAALLLASGYNEVRADPAAVRVYPTDPNWPSLEKMEDEAFLQIITGAQPLEYFDTFVEQWYASGGQAILDKMNQ